MLSRENRLKKDKEYNYIYKKGKYINSSNFTVYYVETKLPMIKIGISTSKKIGNSVVRSRAKRVMSEIIRLNIQNMVIKNYVFLVKPEFVNQTYNELVFEFNKIMKKAKLFKEIRDV